MEVSKPLFLIGFKDKIDSEEKVKRHIAIEILMNMLIGKSSDVYQNLYKDGILLAQPDLDYEFEKDYAHALIMGQTTNPDKVKEEILKEVQRQKENFDVEHFERIKKKIYGEYVTEFNNVSDIARMFLSDYFKGINSFDYVEQYQSVTVEFAKEVLNELFDEKRCILSVIKTK